MKSWIFRLLFPNVHAILKHHEAHVESLTRYYQKALSSLQRSPLDESQWVSKFVALDRDYMALEKEVTELRVENIGLKWRVRDLEKQT
jgi:hypothetical protein